MLEFLEPIDDLLRFRRVLAEAGIDGVDPGHQGAASGDFRHQHAPAVADHLRIDVFIGRRVLDHRIDMHAALVREGIAADVGRLLVVRHIGDLAHRARHRSQLLQALRGNAAVAELQLQVGNDRAKIGIAAALADAIDGALHLGGSRRHRHDRVGHGHFAVVMAMYPDGHREAPLDRARDFGNVARESAAIRIAQAKAVGSGLHRHREGLQRVVGIGFVAIEEMLGVVHHFPSTLLEVADGVSDHAQVLVEGGAQDVGDLIVPALAEYGDGRCSRLQQRQHVAVTSHIGPHLARAAEGDDARMLKPECLDALEELQILRIRARVAGLDVIDAERIESLDNLDLVFHRVGDALRLGAVSQCGIVNGNPVHAGILQGNADYNLSRRCRIVLLGKTHHLIRRPEAMLTQ